MKRWTVALAAGRSMVLLTVAALACVPASQALTAAAPQLPFSNLNTEAGKLSPLKAGVAYQASKFPLALRITPPDATWFGAQWKLSARGFHNTKPPFFGWVAFSDGLQDTGPQGLIEIIASSVRTPSVAVTGRNLKAGHNATYQAISPVTLAGFSGSQLDGTVTGKAHTFIPFTKKQNIARYYGDAYDLDRGQMFRIMVLNVHNRTVVVYISNAALPPADFPSFLNKATNFLKSLTFTG
jgi:hypothetical protein